MAVKKIKPDHPAAPFIQEPPSEMSPTSHPISHADQLSQRRGNIAQMSPAMELQHKLAIALGADTHERKLPVGWTILGLCFFCGMAWTAIGMLFFG